MRNKTFKIILPIPNFRAGWLREICDLTSPGLVHFLFWVTPVFCK